MKWQSLNKKPLFEQIGEWLLERKAAKVAPATGAGGALPTLPPGKSGRILGKIGKGVWIGITWLTKRIWNILKSVWKKSTKDRKWLKWTAIIVGVPVTLWLAKVGFAFVKAFLFGGAAGPAPEKGHGLLWWIATTLIGLLFIPLLVLIIAKIWQWRVNAGRTAAAGTGTSAVTSRWEKAKKVLAFAKEILVAVAAWVAFLIYAYFNVPLWWKWYVVERPVLFWSTTGLICLLLPTTLKYKEKLGRIFGWCMTFIVILVLGTNSWWIIKDGHPAYVWVEEQIAPLMRSTETRTETERRQGPAYYRSKELLARPGTWTEVVQIPFMEGFKLSIAQPIIARKNGAVTDR